MRPLLRKSITWILRSKLEPTADCQSNQLRNPVWTKPFWIGKSIRIGKNDAADFIDEYFAKFSNVRQFMLSTLQQARRDGYVATMSGRRRYLNGIRDFSKLNSQQQKPCLNPNGWL